MDAQVPELWKRITKIKFSRSHTLCVWLVYGDNMATLARYDTWVRSAVGPAAAGAQVFICGQPCAVSTTPTPQVQLYADNAGVTPIAQPLIADGFGHAFCYVASGTYTIVVVYGGSLVLSYVDQSITVGSGNSGNFVTGLPSITTAPAGDIITADGLGNVQDGGVQLSSLAPLASPAFTGAPTMPVLDHVVFADQQSGADVGAKLTNSLAALPSTGGTIDARGFQGAQTWSSVFNLNKSGVTLLLPPSTAANFTVSISGAITLTAVSDVIIRGGKLTVSGSNIRVILPVTSLTNVTIDNVTCVGDGVAAHTQEFFANSSGPAFTNLRILNCNLSNLNNAISINADVAGSVDGFLVMGNNISGTVTTGSSDGYSIHHSNGSGNPSNGRIIGNYISAPSGRHDIYQARGRGVVISGNTSVNHRNSIVGGVQRPAISVGRSQDIVVANNIIENPSDGAIDVFTDDAAFFARNITISGNVVRNPNGFYALVIGTVSPAAAGDTSDVVVIGNTFLNDYTVTTSVLPLLNLNYCINLLVANNFFSTVSGSGTYNMIDIEGIGEVGASATYSNNLCFRGNTIYATGGTSRALRLEAAACGSSVRMEFQSNRISTTSTFSNAASITDVNMFALDNATDGLNVDTFGNNLGVNLALAGALILGGTPPTTSTAQVGLGSTVGFGNGSAGTAVTTTTKSTGTGPTTPQTIVGYLEIDVAGTKYWVPYVS